MQLCYYILRISFLEQACNPVSYGSNVQMTSINATVGSKVSFRCDSGYQFGDHTSNISMSCLDDLTWSNVIGDCLRESTTIHSRQKDYRDIE